MWVSFQVNHNASLVGLINCRGAVSVGFDAPIELQCILASRLITVVLQDFANPSGEAIVSGHKRPSC